MAKKNQEQEFLKIVTDIKKGKFAPIYFLMGDEPYYIDQITDTVVHYALDDADRDFNQTIVYGGDLPNISVVINAAKRYPMMAQRQLVVVKEAQRVDNLELLSYYLQQPLMSTVLVIAYKHGSLKNKKLLAEVEKVGVLFESTKLRDYQLAPFVTRYCTLKHYTIEAKAATMLADSIGSDLSRLVGELDKLMILTTSREKRITPQLVEENIGISKDFNNFELLNALAEKNSYKANQIIHYFKKNPKSNPLVVTVSVLFNFYANLLQLYFARATSEQQIAQELELKSIYQARNYSTAMGRYNAFKCIDIISDLRKCDTRSKGIGGGQISDSDLLKELVFRILH